MNIILLEKIQNLGKLGDKISVKSGYARNYLLPQGKAVLATPDNVAVFEERRAALEKAEAEVLAKAQARSEAINNQVITISVKAGDEGKLFGSVGTNDIVDATKKAGFEVARHEVRMPSGSFRNTGSYEVDIHLHPDVDAKLTVNVVAEE